MTRLPYDLGDEALARATWARLAEPADAAACLLVSALGAGGALEWLLAEALDPDGGPRPDPRPPAPTSGDPGTASRTWAGAAARWAPRLAGLDIRRELGVLESVGGSLLIPGDPWWPVGLDALDRPPHCLWVRGDPALLATGPQGRGAQAATADDLPEPPPSSGPPGRPEDEAHEGGTVRTRTREDLLPSGPGAGRALAVVGARASSAYGERVAADMSGDLTRQGVLVVSGGAFGIDAAAHRGALCEGPTLTVSAGGVERLYPRGNTDLLEEVISTGALVAEVPPGCQPGRHRFLTRNRLIAALSDATVVVEAAWRSGALSTAHHAQELGRPVGAVPGPVSSMGSVGCHRLLRAGAVCVTDAQEALELVTPLGATDPDGDKARDPLHAGAGLLDGLDGDASRVMDAMPARGWAGPAALARSAGLSEKATEAALGLLELAARVESDGSRWRRRRR
ncbi:DNA-processing protein DprA [Actinomyces howellii]|uniref:Transposase and inactivated derivatives n=1 Tax=Actinomyces howellii TaxID=52771 RepID=A0A3S4RVS1_9ACTO|nr:DNA-processing protein DprA [Actinomyces howellii]VEG26932.1 Transposase and inactivated derivatives [Actinomyces howellii]